MTGDPCPCGCKQGYPTTTEPTERPDLCDRCGAILGLTGYRAVHKDGRDLLLCDRHQTEHGDALGKQGWRIEPLVPPEPVAGPISRVQCTSCNGYAAARTVTASPESTPVKILHCRECDRRRCNHESPAGKCDAVAANSADPIRPKGHTLMREATS